MSSPELWACYLPRVTGAARNTCSVYNLGCLNEDSENELVKECKARNTSTVAELK